jgi:energy-coupling factor transporter ATP-binding protein EcfA2
VQQSLKDLLFYAYSAQERLYLVVPYDHMAPRSMHRDVCQRLQERLGTTFEWTETFEMAPFPRHEPGVHFFAFDSTPEGQLLSPSKFSASNTTLKQLVADPYDSLSFEEEAWGEPASPDQEKPVPTLPLDTLPQLVQEFAMESSVGSGFDPGGYAFTLLAHACNALDHRSRVRAGVISAPPNKWVALVGPSGCGKSPIAETVMALASHVEKDRIGRSLEEKQSWRLAKGSDPDLPEPVWKQRHLKDTTVEGLGHVAAGNPEGITLHIDEMTEWLGRMDAYQGNSAKDRGVYLTAHSGGPYTVNRATRDPIFIENLSLGIVTTIQPEVLGEKIRRVGSADGLYARFLFYRLGDQKNSRLQNRINGLTELRIKNLFYRLEQFGVQDLCLNPDGLQVFEEYLNSNKDYVRTLPSGRLSEHLSKFPVLVLRIALGLHCLEAASEDIAPPKTISLSTLTRAMKIGETLRAHSEAVFSDIDGEVGELNKVSKDAMEFILAHQKEALAVGELARGITAWRITDPKMRELALINLIQLNWIRDVTPERTGGRGRPTHGKYLVNPSVHKLYVEKTRRIRERNAAAIAAIERHKRQMQELNVD